jgi:nucleoid-associated protein YgaU
MSVAPSQSAAGAGRVTGEGRPSAGGTPVRRGRISPERRRRAAARRRRRLRGFVRLLALALVIALAVWAGATVANASDDPAFFDEQTYTVHPGDTLWEVAASHYADSDSDLREIEWKIERRNGLDGAALSPGQTLVLPPASEF